MFNYLTEQPTKFLTMIVISHVLTQTYNLVLNSPCFSSFDCFCLPVGCHRSSARFNFRWQYSSQERPMKVLTTLPWMQPCI